jgi:hypothetical protein
MKDTVLCSCVTSGWSLTSEDPLLENHGMNIDGVSAEHGVKELAGGS